MNGNHPRLARRRLRIRPLLPHVELLAIRQGSHVLVHSPAEADQDRLHEVVRERIGVLLTTVEIDLLYLRFVAEWSQATLAAEWGVHRSTIHRQEARILATLHADPILRRLVRLPPFPPEAVQHRAHACVGTSTSKPHAAGANGVLLRIVPRTDRRKNAA